MTALPPPAQASPTPRCRTAISGSTMRREESGHSPSCRSVAALHSCDPHGESLLKLCPGASHGLTQLRSLWGIATEAVSWRASG